MTGIHYFPRYSQKENFATNNSLLLLYRLYDFNRFLFENFLGGLLALGNSESPITFELGLQITQQVGTVHSIVDGSLFQKSLRISIETKLNAQSFKINQLRAHMSGFGMNENGWLILLSPDIPQISHGDWTDISEEAEAKGITLVRLTFQNIIDTARACLREHNEDLLALVADYEDFCSGEGLLPSDSWTLFAPPCGRSHLVNSDLRLYFCPSSWSRRRARYLGIYFKKSIRFIGHISKVVECEIADRKITSLNHDISNDEKQRLLSIDLEDWGVSKGFQFFLCDEMVETDFKKISPGGIMGHRYFDIRELFSKNPPSGLSDLAASLKNVTWM